MTRRRVGVGRRGGAVVFEHCCLDVGEVVVVVSGACGVGGWTR